MSASIFVHPCAHAYFSHATLFRLGSPRPCPATAKPSSHQFTVASPSLEEIDLGWRGTCVAVHTQIDEPSCGQRGGRKRVHIISIRVVLCELFVQAVTLGTFFSGMETPFWALRQLNVKIDHVFACEKDKSCKRFIAANCTSLRTLHSDVTVLKMRSLETVDLFVAGFPCQPFSPAGRQGGADDEQGRGQMFVPCVRYVKANSPKTFLFENVAALRKHKKFKDVYDDMMSQIRKLPYVLFETIINTLDHGVPHCRSRFYLVGIRRDVYVGKFEFPTAVEPLPISAFLERKCGKTEDIPTSKTHKNNLSRTIEKIMFDDNLDLRKQVLIVDVNVGPSRAPVFALDKMPCITRSRGSASGFFIVNKSRMTTARELLRFQGFTEDFVTDCVSDRQIGAMVVSHGFKLRRSGWG